MRAIEEDLSKRFHWVVFSLLRCLFVKMEFYDGLGSEIRGNLNHVHSRNSKC